NAALIVNNYDWMKEQSFLGFIRDVGKHITVNYMMSKDSVRKRIEGEAATGLSFTEFTYQLVQGYDFLHLYRTYNCRLQLGGSDQWGNITTGTELIRRIDGSEAYAITCPLITKTDGQKFGKTENGNVWLDPAKTSPYKFYQFWLNTADDDADRYIRIFTLMEKDQIDEIVRKHKHAPHLRYLQKELARYLTIAVHSEKEYQTAAETSEILFGKGTSEALRNLDEETLLAVFEGVPVIRVAKAEIESGIQILLFLSDKTSIFSSRGEARRMLKDGGVLLNKEKTENENMVVNSSNLLQNRYMLVQKGKKNYYLVIAE
ncbi:MAG TPA: tyrosine--tRNA ligase, partial [Bacteroidales bacterium]|nr:tyrosine--tRNA ligase [Bacteroidales bacterium]